MSPLKELIYYTFEPQPMNLFHEQHSTNMLDLWLFSLRKQCPSVIERDIFYFPILRILPL